MAFIEAPRFPEDISNGATGGPMFNSRVFQTQSGAESILGLWDVPLHQFDVAFGVKHQAQLDVIKQIFWNCRAQLHGFRFKDWQDYNFDFTRGVLVQVGAGIYQIAKVYSFGLASYALRKITKPVVGTIALSRNSVIEPSAHYAIDYTTGLVTYGSGFFPSLSDVLGAFGEFDTPVRFATDTMMSSIDEFDITSWGQIPLREVRTPGPSVGTPVMPSNSVPAPISGSAPTPAPPSSSPGPAPGPSPGPSPTPAPAPTYAKFATPPAFGTVASDRLSVSHAAANYSKGQASGDYSRAFIGSSSAVAGSAAEFTLTTNPSVELHVWVGLNFTTYNSQAVYYFSDDGYGDGPGFAINSSVFAGPGGSGSGGAWATGDKIGLVVYANNDDPTTASVAFFRNGTLIGHGLIDSSLSSPYVFSANISNSTSATAGTVSLNTNIATMAYATQYKAFRESGFAMLDAGSWVAS